MVKGKIITYSILSVAGFFILLLILDNVLPKTGNLWLGIDTFLAGIGGLFQFIFYNNISTFFTVSLIIMLSFTVSYVIGYNVTKKRRVGGSITSTLSIIVWLTQFELTIIWGVLGLLANPAWELQTKLILVIACLPLMFVFIFFMNMLADTISYWADMLKERHEYSRLEYRIETNGKIKVIHFNTDATRLNTVFCAAIFLKVEDILRKEGDSNSISRFLRSSLTNFIYEIGTHFNFWPRFKNKLFRFVGLKIGKDVLISQYTRVDGLLPNLITLEDHTAIGVSSNLITHTFIDRGNYRAFLYGPITICKYARIGANVTITPGITIGEGAVVAAGSLVNKDVPPYTMVGGVPAKPVKELDPETYEPRIEKDALLRRKRPR